LTSPVAGPGRRRTGSSPPGAQDPAPPRCQQRRRHRRARAEPRWLGGRAGLDRLDRDGGERPLEIHPPDELAEPGEGEGREVAPLEPDGDERRQRDRRGAEPEQGLGCDVGSQTGQREARLLERRGEVGAARLEAGVRRVRQEPMPARGHSAIGVSIGQVRVSPSGDSNAPSLRRRQPSSGSVYSTLCQPSGVRVNVSPGSGA
jgi:hypothetical protein